MEKLYKYHQNDENLEKLLKGNYVWLSKPKEFNDPFDFQYSVAVKPNDDEDIESIKQSYREIEEEGHKYSMTLDEMIEEYKSNPEDYLRFLHDELRSQTQDYGVCCLSKAMNDSLMWAHYTNGHKGVCLEFDRFTKESGVLRVLDVEYSNEFPVLKNKEKGIWCLATKSKDWEYEEEVRLIRRSGPGEYRFDKSDLTGITFGCKMDLEVIEELIKLVQSIGYPNVTFYQAKRNPEAYKLKIEKIKKY